MMWAVTFTKLIVDGTANQHMIELGSFLKTILTKTSMQKATISLENTSILGQYIYLS